MSNENNAEYGLTTQTEADNAENTGARMTEAYIQRLYLPTDDNGKIISLFEKLALDLQKNRDQFDDSEDEQAHPNQNTN